MIHCPKCKSFLGQIEITRWYEACEVLMQTPSGGLIRRLPATATTERLVRTSARCTQCGHKWTLRKTTNRR